MALFSVTNPTELLALWRLIAEAKFQANPDDTDLWGSPYVNELSGRVCDALLQQYREKGDEAAIQSHLSWVASLPNNIVLPVVKANLKKDAKATWWQAMSEAEKIAYVGACVLPFQPGREFIGLLISEAEA